MIDLIQKCLDEAYKKLERQTPTTKTKTETISIDDVSPYGLNDFLVENKIPEKCWFYSGDQENGDNGEYIAWDIEIPTTFDDRVKYARKRFPDIAFTIMYPCFTENGYIRKGFNSGLLRDFDDTTVYDMYINKDWERLEKYYSLYFAKKVIDIPVPTV